MKIMFVLFSQQPPYVFHAGDCHVGLRPPRNDMETAMTGMHIVIARNFSSDTIPHGSLVIARKLVPDAIPHGSLVIARKLVSEAIPFMRKRQQLYRPHARDCRARYTRSQ